MYKLFYKYILYLLLCGCISPVLAKLSSDYLLFGRIDVENGLSSNTVYAILQDQEGFLWFGTDDGLNRYDGYNFKIFRNDPADTNSISDNNIWALALDHLGKIWIGTKQGKLNMYNPETGVFTRWQIGSDTGEENSISCIYEDRQWNIWVGTKNEGLYRLQPVNSKIDHWSSDPKNFKSLSQNYVRSIREDNFGNLLVATYGGFNKFNPSLSNDFDRYYHVPEDLNSLSSNTIWALSYSSLNSNLIWMGTANGLTIYNSSEDSFERVDIPNPEGLVHGRSVGFVIEEMINENRIIYVNSYAGLIRMNLSTGKAIRYLSNQNNPHSLIDKEINQIIKDRSGVIWIATENGISFLSSKNSRFSSGLSDLSTLNVPNTLSKKNISAIAETQDGKIWFGTTEGLYYFNTKIQALIIYPGLEKVPVWSLTAGSTNDLWVGSFGAGLKQIHLVSGKISSWDLEDPRINAQSRYYNKALLKDSRNNIWVGYWGVGVSRIKPSSGEFDVWLSDINDSLSISSNDVWVIKEDKLGRIWLGTLGGGLNLFEDGEKVKFRRWTEHENSTTSLNSNNIYSIYVSSNQSLRDNEVVLWIGTDNGLNKFSIKNKSADVYDFEVETVSYSVKDGLPNNSVKSILEDGRGNLWIGTGQGFSFFDTKNNLFTNFTTSDGLPGSVFNYESAVKLKNGLILFGSTNGLASFSPKEIALSSFSPSVQITDFLVNNKSVNLGNNSLLKKSVEFSDQIILDYDQDVFTFEFAALDYNSPNSIQYAYIMEGFDNEWVYSGNRRLATYTNLDPGEYVFKVKATNADGVWNENIKSLSIIITPPFWMTWWFRVLFVLLFLSTGPIIYYRRVSRLKKERQVQVEFSKQLLQSQEEERKRVAFELHDSLGQDLLVIKNLALLKKEKDEQFNEISKIAGAAIDEVRRISYNLHPYQLDRLGLTKAIGSMFSNLTNVSPINFDLEIENIDGLFSKEKEINIFRIIQECVTNIIKHSDANSAKVIVEKTEGVLLIKIADNGRGFNFESTRTASKGFGLKNLENRVLFLGGKFEFNLGQEYKTNIKVSIPFN